MKKKKFILYIILVLIISISILGCIRVASIGNSDFTVTEGHSFYPTGGPLSANNQTLYCCEHGAILRSEQEIEKLRNKI